MSLRHWASGLLAAGLLAGAPACKSNQNQGAGGTGSAGQQEQGTGGSGSSESQGSQYGTESGGPTEQPQGGPYGSEPGGTSAPGVSDESGVGGSAAKTPDAGTAK